MTSTTVALLSVRDTDWSFCLTRPLSASNSNAELKDDHEKSGLAVEVCVCLPSGHVPPSGGRQRAGKPNEVTMRPELFTEEAPAEP